MADSSYKNTNGLMRHLRDSGIDISGSRQKRLLINCGYYHGYKGYRFYKQAITRLPFTSFDEVYNTIEYDTKLKSLLYSKIMFIETALKNIVLATIMNEIKSNCLQDMYDKVISSYKNAPVNSSQETKNKLQYNKFKLQQTIQNAIMSSYRRENPKITHFYNNGNYDDVPLWAVFEILTMGDFGYLISCLVYGVRDKISKELGIYLSSDTNRTVVHNFIYALKDLRNAVAHNDVIYDTRFSKISPNKAMKQCLTISLSLGYINFKTITDYIILICYFMKKLYAPKTEIKKFIRDFEVITEDYRNSINEKVTEITLHSDNKMRLNSLKKYIDS